MASMMEYVALQGTQYMQKMTDAGLQ